MSKDQHALCQTPLSCLSLNMARAPQTSLSNTSTAELIGDQSVGAGRMQCHRFCPQFSEIFRHSFSSTQGCLRLCQPHSCCLPHMARSLCGCLQAANNRNKCAWCAVFSGHKMHSVVEADRRRDFIRSCAECSAREQYRFFSGRQHSQQFSVTKSRQVDRRKRQREWRRLQNRKKTWVFMIWMASLSAGLVGLSK